MYYSKTLFFLFSTQHIMTYINEYISEEEWGISSPVTPKLLLRQWKRIVNFLSYQKER